MPLIQSLAVYCGSSPGNDPRYTAMARSVGRLIAERGIRLVYGGGGVGMMGAVADAALAGGGSVTGVIPHFLNTRKLKHAGVTDMREVETMHERKRIMVEESDAFLALPGGFGTLDELFEVLTWSQLAIHRLPVGLVNVDGFFDGLLHCLDGMTARGFLRIEDRRRLVSGEDPAVVLDRLTAWEPPPTLKFTLARPGLEEV